MVREEILEELGWILQAGIVSKPEVFLLEHATRYKVYASDEVHEWAREYKGDEEVRRAYGKVRDLLHIRILEAVAGDRLDKGIAMRHLAAFYEYAEKTDTKVRGEMVVKIMSEGKDL